MRVCAPAATTVEALVGDREAIPMARVAGDTFEVRVADARAGDRYRFRVDDNAPWPDPCSRWQPDGVHGASMLIDPRRFAWTDAAWRGVPRHRLVIHELHVGTFTADGTFEAATRRLPELADLGVTAVELMPVAAFPGGRNWGYDGAALFAPSENYGHPDDLRALVDRAHALGLAVILDVVYNHLGPDGAYLAAFMTTFFSDRHDSPWGRGINLDGPGSQDVRRLICDNALQWLIEYHFDGLRLDATHALADDSGEHILAQLSREIAAHVPDREVHLIAEDDRNLDVLVQPTAAGGYGLTGVWADDFHHAVRHRLAGDDEAWFSDFTGDTTEIARIVREGWLYAGQHSNYHGGPRGTSPAHVPIDAPVICLQNHDQVGNRAHGERLHQQIDRGVWLAASALLLTAPETPMLFMGQEWAASAPFLFFTDHGAALGALVVEGRRNEFGRFAAFSDPQVRERIPNPQDESTWRRSVIDWDERERPAHAHVLAETRALLAIRAAHLCTPRERAKVRCEAMGSGAVCMRQPSSKGGELLTLVVFDGGAVHRVPDVSGPFDLLHATRPHQASVVHTIRFEGDTLVVESAQEAFGLVLHLPESRP